MNNQSEAKLNRIIKYSIISVVVLTLAVIGVVIGINFNKSSRDAAKSAVSVNSQMTIPKYATADGSFHILPDGSVDTSANYKTDDNKVRFEMFFDPMCPGCGIVDRGLAETFAEDNKNGKIDMFLNPISFLDRSSSDNYSSRSVNALITVAENDPQHFYSYMTALYKNQPKEGNDYIPVSTEKLEEIAQNVGVSEDITKKFKEGSYTTWIKAHSSSNMTRDDLFPNKTFSTPALFLGGKIDEKDNSLKNSTMVLFKNSETLKQDYSDTLNKVAAQK